MSAAFTRLRSAAFEDSRVVKEVEQTFRDMLFNKEHPLVLLNNLALTIHEWHNLAARVVNNAVIFTDPASRAEHPPFFMVSLNAGQGSDPDAVKFRNGTYSLIQLFDGGTDEAEVAGHRPNPADRGEA